MTSYGSEYVPEGTVFVIGADAFDPPPGVDPQQWLAERAGKIEATHSGIEHVYIEGHGWCSFPIAT